MLAQFPFQLQGFHADSGREFVNKPVAKTLNKLLIELRNVNSNSKVNDSTPRSRRNQLRGNRLHPDQLHINRNGQYTVAFFNRSIHFASPYFPSLQAHT